MTLTEKLVAVQSKMKAPKNLRNTFGGYNYRNAEGIFEAFKPYGAELGLALIVTDDVQLVGNSTYIKATATLYDMENPADSISVTALAREAESKKGMDSAQVTGATSSYARKYALNGLFLLDDTKDPDTDEYRVQEEAMQKKRGQDAKTQALVLKIKNTMIEKGYSVSKRAEEQLNSMDEKALQIYLNKIEESPKKEEK